MTNSPAMSAAARGRETPDAGAFLGKEGGINPSLALHSNHPGEPQRAWPEAGQVPGHSRLDQTPPLAPAWHTGQTQHTAGSQRGSARSGLPSITASPGFPQQEPARGSRGRQQDLRFCLGAHQHPEQQWQRCPSALALTRPP